MARRKLQQPAISEDLLPDNIQGPARDLLRHMFDGWTARSAGTKRHKDKTVHASLSVIADFIGHAGKIPGQLTGDDFDQWALHLARDRKISIHTQRHYYSHVRLFLAYLLKNMNLRNNVRALFGADIVQLVDEDSAIPHKHDKEGDADEKIAALTHDEIEQFFAALDSAIAFRHSLGVAKSILCLLRDKAMFSIMYACGLRISEVSGVSVDSFSPNPEFPEFGQFGFVHIYGKGDKWRTVPIMKPDTVDLLSKYFAGVRPRLKGMKGDPNEAAFFVTERGTRITASAIYARFSVVLKEAGTHGTGIHPHRFRGASVTHHGLGGMEMDSVRVMHGHAYGATTQGYFNPPSQFVADDFSRATCRYLDDAEKMKRKS